MSLNYIRINTDDIKESKRAIRLLSENGIDVSAFEGSLRMLLDEETDYWLELYRTSYSDELEECNIDWDKFVKKYKDELAEQLYKMYDSTIDTQLIGDITDEFVEKFKNNCIKE